MDIYGKAWDYRYGVAYYLYALIFLAFDVDILYLFPVAAAFDKVSGIRGIVEFFIFLGILILAVVYAWAKGVFTWERKIKIRRQDPT
jgi:NADH-quinone oxidoreductase subunit A